MIKLYKDNDFGCANIEATQEDIDQWNLDRGGPRMWGCSNKGGDTVMHDYQNGKFTHTMVSSAPQEIVVEKYNFTLDEFSHMSKEEYNRVLGLIKEIREGEQS